MEVCFTICKSIIQISRTSTRKIVIATLDVMSKVKFNLKENGDGRQNQQAKFINEDIPSACFAQKGKSGYKCFCCGSDSHILYECDKKESIPRDQWFQQTGQTHFQNVDNNSVVTDGTVDNDSISSRTGWQGSQVSMAQGNSDKSFDFDHLYDCLMLDSGTTHSIIANEKLLIGITAAKVPLRMSTNAGEKTIAKEAQLLGAGMVYHDVSFIANPLSLGELSDKYRITMDPSVDNAFYVHMDNGRIVKFSRVKNNLLSCQDKRKR